MNDIWSWGKDQGMTDAGIAGLMGNLQAESGLNPTCVDYLCLKRLRERGKEYTHKTYTAAVDSGAISRAEFLNPIPGKRYGYGLCQWTTPSRKAGLYDLCKAKGVSIGDLQTQLEYLEKELTTTYCAVWKTLITTQDILTASDAVLKGFEMPADTGESVSDARGNMSKKYYDLYAGEAKKVEATLKKVIEVAAGEIGYLEKASDAWLDDKTKNAGSSNYTKYWRDVFPRYQGLAWCACFVSWCFLQAYGLDEAKRLLKHWPFVYCPTLASMTKDKTPRKGAVVLFCRGGEYVHTGIVAEVTTDTITTVEGNTNGGAGIVANGGGVFKKVYQRTALDPQTRFFMPSYGARQEDKKGDKYMFSVDTVRRDTQSKSARLLQTLLRGQGYKGADGKALAIDGYAGTQTISALTSYQWEKGLAVDGVCGPLTWAAILGL